MAGEKIARMIKDAKGYETEQTNIVYGRVSSVNPLIVEIEGRFPVTRDHLVLSRTVQDLTLEFNVNDYSASQTQINVVPVSGGKVDVDADVGSATVTTNISANPRTIRIQIFRDLQVNDRVSMIRAQKGQMYYILDRRA